MAEPQPFDQEFRVTHPQPGGRSGLHARAASFTLGMMMVVSSCGGLNQTPASTTAPATLAPTAASTESPTPSSAISPTLTPAPSAVASAAATGTPGASLPAGTAAGTLTWTDCGAPFECSTLGVPLDYGNAGGRQITLALIRLPAEDPAQRVGALVTNPGGPGGSGVEFVRDNAQSIYSEVLRTHFDIVGFDPRGVGASTPVECLNGPDLDRLNALDPTTDTPAERAALIAGAKEFDAACEQNSGSLLPFMTTVDVARDLDRIRIALGEPRLSYFGFSYGTFIGTEYAGLFADKVRALVLDGPIDPTQGLEQRDETQAVAFDDALSRFLADCAARPTCAFYNNGKPAAAFDALMAKIDAQALPATALGDPRPVGPGEASTGVLASLYSRSSWRYLEQGLAMAQRGDGSVLLLLADSYNERQPDGTYSNSAAANNAVNCTDYVASTRIEAYDALAAKLEKVAPRFGRLIGYSGLTCAFWPVHAGRDPGEITADGAAPILIVGTTGDPATPYSWAVSLAKQLTSGVLLTRVGEGHTGYSDSPCIAGHVDQYLIALKVPAADTTCQP